MPSTPNQFIWYELMTPDIEAAEAFYSPVVGWELQPMQQPGTRYTVVAVGGRGVAGLMQLSQEAGATGTAPCWVGYIYSEDVDAATRNAKLAGASIKREPVDIPGIGRFSVVADPQGAAFMLFKPNGEDRPPVPAGTAGQIGWHELFSSDWEQAFDFYSSQFGWTKAEAMDMGPMGTYQLFSAGGDPIGGMMNRFKTMPASVWSYYFNVDGIDAAAARVKDHGGTVIMGPHEVPGGNWVVQCSDPQGAMFALLSRTR